MHNSTNIVSEGRNCPKCHTSYPPGVIFCPKDNLSTTKIRYQKGKNPLIGSFIGSYCITKTLGRGAMGEVFQGEHPTLGKRVAIKVLRKKLATDHEMVVRFFDEAKVLSNLQHPNLVSLLDLSVLPDGRAYYVMESLEGKSLSALLLEEKTLSPFLSLFLTNQVLAALHVAHEQKIIHRDIKPANIFIVSKPGELPQVKLLDFGIAKFLAPKQDEDTSVSLPGVILGTPAYMAPEQCLDQIITPASDLYAVGVVLFEMLTGSLPFFGADIKEQLQARLTQLPPSLPSYLPNVPKALNKLVLRSLARSRTSRYQSAKKMASAIQKILPSLSQSSYEITSTPKTLEENSFVNKPTTRREKLTEPGVKTTLLAKLITFVTHRQRVQQTRKDQIAYTKKLNLSQRVPLLLG